ncbi:hypothetical protein OY671_009365, partial [Metschnikowia pulcherrima]
MSSTPSTSIKGSSKRFGGIAAVSDVSFDSVAGAVTAMIGPNGAGKTTSINLVTGVLACDGGTISLEGEDITARPTHQRGTAGIARTYQTPQIAHGMSVSTNVMAGAYRFGQHGSLSSVFRPWVVMKENDEMAAR